MLIDIHTHTFPDKLAPATIAHLQQASRTHAFSDGTNTGLRASMERSGIDCSVVLPVATNPRQVEKVNDTAVLVNSAAHQTGILSFGCIHPAMDAPERELERVAALGLKGVKLHPAYQATDFDHPKYLRILKCCQRLGLVVLTHAGVDIGLPSPVYCTPRQVLNALDKVGDVTLILAHLGGWRMWDEVLQLLPQAPVYLDTAFSLGAITPMSGEVFSPADLAMLSQERFMDFVDSFGAERLLFGSDSPWGDQKQDVERIRSLPLSQKDKDAILGGNAKALLGL